MGELGELGRAKPVHEDTFTYFGKPMRVHPRLTETVLADFIEQAGDIPNYTPEDLEDVPPEKQQEVARHIVVAATMTKNFLRKAIHPDDFDTLWETVLEEGQDSEDQMRLARSLIELVTKRPTGRRSASSGGRRGTAQNSGAGSSSAVVHRLEKKGRGDLALLVTERTAAERAARSA